MRILAIDPGATESAMVVYDTGTKTPVRWMKIPNERILRELFPCPEAWDGIFIEMIASYGMPVGAEVFETCMWIGRFIERLGWCTGLMSLGVYRRDVKLHLCGSVKAKDSNVRQAIIDRYGGKAKAIGTKATPGPLYGMKADCWAALGVAITAAER